MKEINGFNNTFFKVYDKYGKLKGIIEQSKEKNVTEDDWLRGVSCFVINEKREILIEKRVNKGLTPGKIDLCSGHIDNNETPTQAMIRELKEELGIGLDISINVNKITTNSVPLVMKSSGKTRNFLIDFYCLKTMNPKIVIQKSEVENISWIPMEECFELMQEGKTKFPSSYNYKSIFEEIEKNVNNIKIAEER